MSFAKSELGSEWLLAHEQTTAMRTGTALEILTNVCTGSAVGYTVKQANETASISDRLLVPNNFLVGTMTCILGLVFVLFTAELLICLAYREDKKEGMRGSRHESEQFRLINTEHVMECKLLREAKLVDEVRHDIGIVLCETCER